MDTLGIVESANIASGIAVTDIMLKAADVELVQATTICSGRYMTYISGDCAAVTAAVTTAESSQKRLRGSYILSNVSLELIAALNKQPSITQVNAIAIIECRNVSSGIAAADKALKSSSVELARLVTGQGINGKSYFILTGDVASVSEAAKVAESNLGNNLIETVVLAQPHISVIKSVLKGINI